MCRERDIQRQAKRQYRKGQCQHMRMVIGKNEAELRELVNDLRANKLVWAARSKTTNPEDVEALVGELAQAVAAELRSEGLVGGK